MKRIIMGGLLAAATLLGGLAITGGTVSATTEHCPDHASPSVDKTNASYDGELNDIVLPAGTEFCVKGSTDATGKLTANGTTSLVNYLDNGHDVSYYVVYPQQVPDPAKLRLTFIQECGTFTPLEGPWVAPAEATWRLRNENAAPVDYVLRQAGGGTIQSGELPVGDSFVKLPFGARTLILDTYNEAGAKVHSDTKAGGDTYLTTDNDGVKCLPPTPEDEITYGEWSGEPECDETSYVETRSVWTTSFTWDGKKFVADPPVVTEEQRTVEVEEVEPCPTTPTTQPPTTEPPVTTQPPTTEPPVTTQPPTTEPPVTTQPPVTTTPVVQTSAPTPPTTAVAPSGALPETGSDSTGLMALIAGLLTLTGVGGVSLARRRS